MSLDVADILVNNHLASFVPATHAISRIFVGPRHDVSFALVPFPATWWTKNGKACKVAALRVYEFDGTDLTLSVKRREDKRIAKFRDASQLDRMGELCRLCLAHSPVDRYETEDADYEYFSCSQSREIYMVDRHTFPDAKYLPLTKEMVEFVWHHMWSEEVVVCERGHGSHKGCSDCVIYDDDYYGPEDYGWLMCIVSGAAREFTQCNGPYMQAGSKYYEDRLVNLDGNTYIATDSGSKHGSGWKLCLDDGSGPFAQCHVPLHSVISSSKSMTVSNAQDMFNGIYSQDSGGKYRNRNGAVMHQWAIGHGPIGSSYLWKLEHSSMEIVYEYEVPRDHHEDLCLPDPCGTWYATNDSKLSCNVSSGSVCFRSCQNSCSGNRHFGNKFEDLPEGTWLGHYDASQHCSVTKMELPLDSDDSDGSSQDNQGWHS